MVGNSVDSSAPGEVTTSDDATRSCPWLGLDGARDSHYREPFADHRCFRGPGGAVQPNESHQLVYCLGSQHADCPVFESGWQEAVKRQPKLANSVRATAPIAGGLPMPVGWVRTTAALAALLLAAGAVFAGSLVAFDRYSTKKSDSSTVQASAQKPSATASVAAAATTPGPTVAATFTPLPTATATPKRTYVVQPGDGYTAIARKLDIDVNQLLRVNNRTIDTPLFPGAVLELP